MNYLKTTTALFIIFLLTACGGGRQPIQKSPVDILVRDLTNESNFTVLLYDMDYDESMDSYKHQYKILIDRTEPQDTVLEINSEWVAVSDAFFQKHQEDMGMEIVSKQDGVVNKAVSPAGHSGYVGNEKYGRWEQRDGGSFWAFYGKYMFLSSMFRMAMYPVGYSHWNNYRSNYYGRGNSYYGQGNRKYGTNSDYNKKNKNSKWNNKSSAFKQKVRSRVNKSVSNKRSRRTSRYSRSSSRSRGGGFGK